MRGHRTKLRSPERRYHLLVRFLNSKPRPTNIMGQAKKRGTFEERKQQSIEASKIRQAEADAEWDRRQAERQAAANAKWDAMSDEEKHAARTRAARQHRGDRGDRMPLGALGILPLLMLAGCGGRMMPNIRARR